MLCRSTQSVSIVTWDESETVKHKPEYMVTFVTVRMHNLFTYAWFLFESLQRVGLDILNKH